MKILPILASLSLFASPCFGAVTIYSLDMDGNQEVGGGDIDGFSVGTLSLDDVTGDVSWNFVYSNIDALTDMHIHGPNGSAGTNAGVFVGLGVATTGGEGTLINSVNTTPANIAAILANPTDFYVNIHNAEFPAGAVRGQLGTVIPEPSSALLLALGGSFLLMRRRPRAMSFS